MAFTLHVDASVFHGHLQHVQTELAGVDARLTPVVKGNGYGFGRVILAKESARLNVQRICVGTVWEVNSVVDHFPGFIHVLEPLSLSDEVTANKWRDVLLQYGDRVIITVSDTDLNQLTSLGVQHIIIDCATSLHRFGLPVQSVAHVVNNLASSIQLHGFNVHLPIAEPDKKDSNDLKSAKAQEVLALINNLREQVVGHDVPLAISVSHLTSDEIKTISTNATNVSIDVRLGTKLWLGASGALKVTGTVLAVHDVATSDRVGYTQTKGGKKLVVVSGGTSHGVALAAPITTSSIRKRFIAVAEGLAQATGKVRSPFVYQGSNLMFAEPPHMHVSLLWCDDPDIQVGDQLLCTVRNTTASFDAVIGLN